MDVRAVERDNLRFVWRFWRRLVSTHLFPSSLYFSHSLANSVVIQLAKLKGLASSLASFIWTLIVLFSYRMKVIASAGSDAKVEYMRSLGADFPFNYKTTSYSYALAKHGPIHAFWVR